jgi:tRNA threonylcarbamoyladenosine biosynthesis protein TsaB
MNILALEASHDCALVAANVDEKIQVRSALRLDEPRALARDLAIYTARALENAGWNFDDVDVLAVGIGPGSWTSLRIALSTWKTLSLACEIPLAGVASFDAVALAARNSNLVSTQSLVVVTDRCRPGEIYAKTFACDEKIEALTTEEVVAPTEYSHRIVEIAAARDWPIFATGDVAENLIAELKSCGATANFLDVKTEDVALAIAEIGAQKLNEKPSSPLELLPLYVAASSAERVAQERAAQERLARQNAAL